MDRKFYLIYFDTGFHDEFRLFSDRRDALRFINEIMRESGHDWETESDIHDEKLEHICWSRVEFGQWLHLRIVTCNDDQPIVNPLVKKIDNDETL